MSGSFRDDLEYPNLSTCNMRLVGSAAMARPPVELPREIRERATAAPYPPNGKYCESLDGFSLERAVLKRKEEREKDRALKGATSKEALEHAIVTKMKTVTGAKESVCISMLRDHGYNVEESIEAYLESM